VKTVEVPRWTRRVERSLLCAAAAPLSGVPAAGKLSVGTETDADGDTLPFLVGRAGLRRWLLALGEAQAVTRGETCWPWLCWTAASRKASRHPSAAVSSPSRSGSVSRRRDAVVVVGAVVADAI
jgi:hypothetical protein